MAVDDRQGDEQQPRRERDQKPDYAPQHVGEPRLVVFLGAVEPLAQLLARLEEGHELFLHRNSLAGAWIAPLPRRAMLNGEGAKPAQLHTIPPRQRFDDLVEHHLHDTLHITMIEMRI